MRSGNVAIVGRTNVGKSTFLNAALGEPLAITSALPQTTRDALLGVVTLPRAQIAFVDTPGIHRPRTELGRRMNAAAIDALRDADVVLVMTDTHRLRPSVSDLPVGAAPAASRHDLPSGDVEVVAQLPADTPAVLVINKVDRCADKRDLLGVIQRFAALRDFTAIVPASARDPRDVERILGVLGEALPERPPAYDPETLTDRPALFFVREYVREQVLRQTAREVPHAVAVTVESASDQGEVLVIQATIHVEKAGQRGILVGAGGTRLREVGAAARLRIEELLGRRIYLELFVRVTPRWKHMPRQLAELGYDAGGGGGHVTPSPRRPASPAAPGSPDSGAGRRVHPPKAGAGRTRRGPSRGRAAPPRGRAR